MVVGIDRTAIGVAVAVGYPGAAAGSDNRFQGGYHAAGRRYALDATAVVPMLVGFPVGDQEELVVPQPGSNEIVKGFFIPHGSSPCSWDGNITPGFVCRRMGRTGLLETQIGVLSRLSRTGLGE